MTDPHQPRVVLALNPPAEHALEPLLFATDAPLRLLATTLEADELLASVAEHQPDAVLLSPEFSGLSAAHCERIRATGTRLVGLALHEHERTMLQTLGVQTQIDPAVSRTQLLAAIGGDDPTATREVNPPGPASAMRRERGGGEGHGTLVATIGSKGAPGSSECAAGLAALAASRWPTLLVELDALGGGLSLRLGADPADGSILGLVRASQNSDTGLQELIERWCCQRDEWPAVLLGPPPDADVPREMTEPGAVTRALEALTRVYPLVVCDVGFQIAQVEQPVARVHREALIAADAVLLVLGCSEAQLRDGLRQLDVILNTLEVAPERLRILANGLGAPSSAAKDTLSATIAERLADTGLTVDGWLSWDERGARRARREGLPIALARRRRRGQYARALSTLLDDLFLPDAGTAPKTKRRKLRLTAPKPPRQDSAAPRPEQQQQEEEVALPWQT